MARTTKMSEDQIRAELAEIRALVREGHAETILEMKDLKKEIIEDVDKRNSEMRNGMYWMIGIFVTFVITFSSWIAADHLNLKKEHETLKTDFGLVLLSTASSHKDAIGYRDILDKYFPSRGQ